MMPVRTLEADRLSSAARWRPRFGALPGPPRGSEHSHPLRPEGQRSRGPTTEQRRNTGLGTSWISACARPNPLQQSPLPRRRCGCRGVSPTLANANCRAALGTAYPPPPLMRSDRRHPPTLRRPRCPAPRPKRPISPGSTGCTPLALGARSGWCSVAFARFDCNTPEFWPSTSVVDSAAIFTKRGQRG